MRRFESRLERDHERCRQERRRRWSFPSSSSGPDRQTFYTASSALRPDTPTSSNRHSCSPSSFGWLFFSSSPTSRPRSYSISRRPNGRSPARQEEKDGMGVATEG